MSKPDFREAANRHANLIYKDDYTKRICGAADFQIGAHHGYDLAMEQHRDFYLLVRELFQLYDSRYSETKGDPFTVAEKAEKIKVRIIMLEKEIEKRLAAFTSRELESLPFKD